MSLLQEMTKEIGHLKPIPAVVSQLAAAANDPDAAVRDVADIVQFDPVITVQVLKVCNSAFFGLRNPAESIRDAVNMLGIDQVVELVLMKSSATALSGQQKGYGLEAGDLWRYSVSSAVITRLVAERLALENKHTLFTCALIKDIGKVLLEKHVDRKSDAIRQLVEKEGYSFLEAEKKIFGFDHAELGALIIKMWQFSPVMVKIVRHHHLPDDALVTDRDIAAVYLSDCISMMLGEGVGSDGLSYRFRDRAMTVLGITADDMAEIIADFGFRMQEIETLLQIV